MAQLLGMHKRGASGDVDNPLKNEPLESYPCEPMAYEFEGRIGSGAFAAVYVAKCKEKNTRVAIKVIELEKEDKEKEGGTNWDELQKEAAVVRRMHHPNIVSCYASFVVEAELWLVMPLLSGGSCQDIIKNVPEYNNGIKDEAILATIIKDVLQGISYCHKDGRIHRDIKAANILLAYDGTAQLSDFGVSGAIIEGGLRKHGRNTFTGSLWWMAPEVLQRETKHGFPADIWSLGITLLELAFGKPPHSSQRPVKVMLTILQSPPPNVDCYDDKNHKLSKKYKDFVAKCLQKEPGKRPSAKDLLSHNFLKLSKDHKYVVDTVVSKAPELQIKKSKQMLPKSISKIANEDAIDDKDTHNADSIPFDFRISDGGNSKSDFKKDEIDNMNNNNNNLNQEEPQKKGRFQVLESSKPNRFQISDENHPDNSDNDEEDDDEQVVDDNDDNNNNNNDNDEDEEDDNNDIQNNLPSNNNENENDEDEDENDDNPQNPQIPTDDLES